MSDLVAEYLEHYALTHAQSSVDTYTDVLRRMDRELPYGLISACEEELRAWIYSDTHRAAHRKLCRTIAVGFYEWANNPHAPRLDLNPAVALPLVAVAPGRPKPVDPARKFDLLARAAMPYRAWFLIACLTGARCTELANLDREHIDPEWTLLHGKGNKLRQVPTLPAVWALAQMLPPGPVAVETRGRHCGERLTRQQVSHRGNYQLQKVLGLDGVHMHRLRSTYGTEAYAQTKDIMAVMRLMGHASPATTQIYVGVGDEALKSAVAGLRAA